MLVLKEETDGEVYARMVAHKGLHEGEEGTWVVSDILEELKSWGHQGGEKGHVILKSDGERAIGAVLGEVARKLGGKVVMEKTPKGESQSNGAVEEAGKRVREMAKVLMDMIEHKTKAKIKLDSTVMQWLIRWAAMLLSRYKVGPDGKTAYERRRWRKCSIPLAAFGEKVWYTKLEKEKAATSLTLSGKKEYGWDTHEIPTRR